MVDALTAEKRMKACDRGFTSVVTAADHRLAHKFIQGNKTTLYMKGAVVPQKVVKGARLGIDV